LNHAFDNNDKGVMMMVAVVVMVAVMMIRVIWKSRAEKSYIVSPVLWKN